MSLDPIIQTYGNPLLCFSIASVKHILIEQYKQFYGQYNGFDLLSSIEARNISQDHTTSPEIESLADTHQPFDITYMQLQSYIKEKESCSRNNLQGQSCSCSLTNTTTGSTLTSTTSTTIMSTTITSTSTTLTTTKLATSKSTVTLPFGVAKQKL